MMTNRWPVGHLISLLIGVMLYISPVASAEPAPGEVFREYLFSRRTAAEGRALAEVDPGATYPAAVEQKKELPCMADRKLTIASLQHATRAEMVVEYWGGHIGTSQQSFKVNGNDFIDIPQPDGTPQVPQSYQRVLLKATVPVPLEQLKEGTNIVQFRAGPQIYRSFNWGLYWVYDFTVRVYYDPAQVPHRTGTISRLAGTSLPDNPTFTASIDPWSPAAPAPTKSPSTQPSVPQVHFIGNYDDFNWEGDGRWRQWHYQYRYGNIAQHLGTATDSPYRITWDTTWIPDQPQPMKLIAWIVAEDGTTYVTQPVESLTFKRRRSVRMFKSADVPQAFSVRIGQTKSCTIPVEDDLTTATAARLVLSTWSAEHEGEIFLNGVRLRDHFGRVHDYSYDMIDVPLDLIRAGTNTFSIRSDTEEHAPEVNWPGPAILIEHDPAKPRPVRNLTIGAGAEWWNSRWSCRVPIVIPPQSVAMHDKSVELAIHFTWLFKTLNETGRLAEGSLRLIEVEQGGRILNAQVPFQFDRSARYKADTLASGQLTFLLSGWTPPNTPRYYELYFDRQGDDPATQPTTLPATFTIGRPDSARDTEAVPARLDSDCADPHPLLYETEARP